VKSGLITTPYRGGSTGTSNRYSPAADT